MNKRARESEASFVTENILLRSLEEPKNTLLVAHMPTRQACLVRLSSAAYRQHYQQAILSEELTTTLLTNTQFVEYLMAKNRQDCIIDIDYVHGHTSTLTYFSGADLNPSQGLLIIIGEQASTHIVRYIDKANLSLSKLIQYKTQFDAFLHHLSSAIDITFAAEAGYVTRHSDRYIATQNAFSDSDSYRVCNQKELLQRKTQGTTNEWLSTLDDETVATLAIPSSKYLSLNNYPAAYVLCEQLK